MNEVDASGILDIVLSGTTATLLLDAGNLLYFVNMNNATLYKLINNKEAYEAVMKIEALGNLVITF